MLSYCDVGGRLVFLDTNADRYFCLHAEAEVEFRKLASSAADLTSLSHDVESGELFAGSGEPPRPCVEPVAARASLLDRPAAAAALSETWLALARLQHARLRFRLQSLAGALASFTKAKRRSATNPASADDLSAAMAGFLAAERMLSTRDLCLSHSYAIARHLLAHGIDASLVLGVRIGPFAAHCWVQHRDLLVNDRLDTVRTFTPILAL